LASLVVGGGERRAEDREQLVVFEAPELDSSARESSAGGALAHLTAKELDLREQLAEIQAVLLAAAVPRRGARGLDDPRCRSHVTVPAELGPTMKAMRLRAPTPVLRANEKPPRVQGFP
jgi:hypothetical protein